MIQIDEQLLKDIMSTRDGSVELFFDDIGLVQQVIFRRKRKKREGETIEVFSIKNGTAIANFDHEGNLQRVLYETIWKRKKNLT